MSIFKDKKKKLPAVSMAQAPEVHESKKEEEYVKSLSKNDKSSQIEIREIPVCLSQAQVNTMVLENNIMLKQIIAEI